MLLLSLSNLYHYIIKTLGFTIRVVINKHNCELYATYSLIWFLSYYIVVQNT